MKNIARTLFLFFLSLNTLFTFAVSTFRVTYYVAGIKYVAQRSAGELLQLPTPPDCGDMPFYGWSTSFSSENPTFVSNSLPVSADMIVHAIFRRSPADSCYARVTEQLDDWRGQYLIVYKRNVANGQVGGSSKSGGIGYGSSSNKGFPSDYDKEKDLFPTNFGDKYAVTLEAVDDAQLSAGYLMKTQDGLYNYATSKSSGITTSPQKSVASKNPIKASFLSVDDISLSIDKKNFKYNAGTFSFYNKDVSKVDPISLYKRTVIPAVYSLGLPETVKITSAKYATYCSDRALDFSTTGITPYAAVVEDGVVKLSIVSDGIVPPGTGVILYKDVEETEEIAVPFTIYDIPLVDNDLIGTTERTKVCQQDEGGNYNYILQRSGESISFNMALSEGAWLAAHRAYLSTSYCAANSQMAAFFPNDVASGDDVTGGVGHPVRSASASPTVYNLQGQRLKSLRAAGLYIVNGRKVLVR